MFRFYVNLRERPATWGMSIIFIIVGGIIFFFLPAIVGSGPDRNIALWLIRILGGVFLGLGGLTFLWLAGDLYLKYRHSEQRENWYWWGSFVGPLLAAGLFAVPATLMFPLMLLAYLFSPNLFFPANSPNVANNLVVGLIFSVAGLLSLGLMYLVGRTMYRKRPHRRHRKD